MLTPRSSTQLPAARIEYIIDISSALPSVMAQSMICPTPVVRAFRIAANIPKASIIPPPVEVDRFTPSAVQEPHYLIVSRLVPYKRIDLAVEAFTRLGRPLTIIGDGSARAELERIAGPTVRFLGRLSDTEVSAAYARCQALLFPGEEDFGIVPLEANAAGRPVIAFQRGGALDTVVPGVTGTFFSEQTPESLIGAVLRSEATTWDQVTLRRHAESFREEVFAERMRVLIDGLYHGTLAHPPATAA